MKVYGALTGWYWRKNWSTRRETLHRWHFFLPQILHRLGPNPGLRIYRSTTKQASKHAPSYFSKQHTRTVGKNLRNISSQSFKTSTKTIKTPSSLGQYEVRLQNYECRKWASLCLSVCPSVHKSISPSRPSILPSFRPHWSTPQFPMGWFS